MPGFGGSGASSFRAGGGSSSGSGISSSFSYIFIAFMIIGIIVSIITLIYFMNADYISTQFNRFRSSDAVEENEK